MIGWIIIIVLVLAILASSFYIYFNRNPVRVIPSGKSILSPADGKIIEIIDMLDLKKKKPNLDIRKKMIEKIKASASDISKHCYVIIILTTPLNVRVQRATIDGKVLSVKHAKGGFLETLIKNKDIGKIKVIQTKGFFTRKIESSVKKNEDLLKGQRIGKIKLGSQAMLIIPDYPLKVKIGNKVSAGETIIAEY